MLSRVTLLKGARDIAIEDRELVPGENDVLVKTHLAGICGTDKNLYRGIIPKMGSELLETGRNLDFPILLGHEGGSEVVELGPRVSGLSVGDRVMSFCWCGTFADYFVAPAGLVQRVPEGMDFDIACLGEPVACAMFSGLNSGVQLGDIVGVVGAGFAGQILAQVARKKGAKTVIVVDIDDAKLQLAARLGADVIINSKKEDPVDTILRLTKGKGADVMFEAAGTADSINACTSSVRKNGIIVMYSWVTQPVTLNISRWHDESIEIRNTGLVHHTPQERFVWAERALRPVRDGMIDIESLITHRFQLSEIQKAFDCALDDPGALKIVIKP